MCPLSVRTSAPVLVSHTFAVPSLLADTTRLLSGLNATSSTVRSWRAKERGWVTVSAATLEGAGPGALKLAADINAKAAPWAFGVSKAYAFAQSPAIRKFVTSLPGLGPAGASTLHGGARGRDDVLHRDAELTEEGGLVRAGAEVIQTDDLAGVADVVGFALICALFWGLSTVAGRGVMTGMSLRLASSLRIVVGLFCMTLILLFAMTGFLALGRPAGMA